MWHRFRRKVGGREQRITLTIYSEAAKREKTRTTVPNALARSYYHSTYVTKYPNYPLVLLNNAINQYYYSYREMLHHRVGIWRRWNVKGEAEWNDSRESTRREKLRRANEKQRTTGRPLKATTKKEKLRQKQQRQKKMLSSSRALPTFTK